MDTVDGRCPFMASPPSLAKMVAPPEISRVAERKSPLEFLRDLVRTHGDYARYSTAFGPVHFFNHPDQVQTVLQGNQFLRTSLSTAILGQGLLASEGELWRRQRRLMQPTFHERNLAAFVPAVTKAVEEMLRRWETDFEGRGAFDLANEMRRLALDVVFRALFSKGAGESADRLCDAVGLVIEDLGRVAASCFQAREQFAPGRNAQFQSAKATLDEFVQQMIAERREQVGPPPDLLTILLSARDEHTGEPIAAQQIHDEIVTMIIAGHETTALTLGWCWLMLDRNSLTEMKLAREIEETLGGRPPIYQDLPKLACCTMALKETMRLYPPVWSMMRATTIRSEIAGVSLPAGSLVLICPYTTHRHPAFWEDPEQFDPARFSHERSFARHRFAYLPFSGGRHHCLGMGFADMEMPLLLAAITQRYRIHFAPDANLQPVVSLTLRQPEGFRVSIERRR